MGSVAASIYHGYLGHHLSALHLPASAAGAAHDSIGGAATAATQVTHTQAEALAAVARHGFIQGLDAASWVAVAVAVAGALVALYFLPSGMRVGAGTPEHEPDPDSDRGLDSGVDADLELAHEVDL